MPVSVAVSARRITFPFAVGAPSSRALPARRRFHAAVISLSVWNDAGLVSTIGTFELDDLDAAIARLHELAP
jgi:hypothetical protein